MLSQPQFYGIGAFLIFLIFGFAIGLLYNSEVSPLIHIQNLGKHYGSFRALSDVNLEVADEQVFGLLGPNGAGKTTLLRILATLLKPSVGKVSVAGFNTEQQSKEVRRRIGIVNGGMGLPDRLTGREILKNFAGFYDLDIEHTEKRILELDERLELGRTLDVRASEYSTGMKQKIIIARAVLHDPAVLILDEASSGLDIFARRALLDFVSQTRATGKLTIYSTHVMSEAEEICDNITILHKGRILYLGGLTQILERTGEKNLERAFFALLQELKENEEQGDIYAS